VSEDRGDDQALACLDEVGALTRLAAMPAKKRLAVLIAIAALAAAVAGCGSDEIGGTLTPEQATRLNDDLDAVQDATGANQCSTARSAVRDYRTDVFELPSEAGTELKAALQDGGQQLSSLVADQCGTAAGATGSSGEQPAGSQSSNDSTSSTTSTPTTTTPDPTSAPTEEPPSPPGGGNGNGLGNGNAGGNGNGQANGNPGGGNTGGGSTDGTGGIGVGGD
jgi:hypothetical protein